MKKRMTSQMKKAWLALFSALCALMLMGCSTVKDALSTNSPAATVDTSPSPQAQNSAVPTSQSDLKDGQYKAQTSDAYAEANQGWREYVVLTVSGGKVTDVEYDAEKDGKKKRDTTEEEYPMTPHPSKWIPELEEKLKNAMTPEDIDTVTGATRSSQTAKQLYAAALNAARSGNTAAVTLADEGTPEEEATNPQTTNQQGGQE